jgi:hypothetical protein
VVSFHPELYMLSVNTIGSTSSRNPSDLSTQVHQMFFGPQTDQVRRGAGALDVL